jgi:hypothetical protein
MLLFEQQHAVQAFWALQCASFCNTAAAAEQRQD